MMHIDDLDRTFQTWFETDAAGPEPTTVLVRVLDATRTRTPRPSWLVTVRGGGIGARGRTRPWAMARSIPAMLLLGLLVVLAIVAAAIVGQGPSLVPAPAVSNGWIAFATNPSRDTDWASGGERRDIYLTGEGVTPRVIVGYEDDRLSQGCPRFSPDGSMMAYGLGDESVRVPMSGKAKWPVTNRAVVVVEVASDGTPSREVTRFSLGTDLGPLPCPEWSPDGSRLAFFTGSELRVVELVSGATTSLPGISVVHPLGNSDPPGWASLDFEWAPDGTAISVAEVDQIRSIPIDGAPATVRPIPGLLGFEHAADGRIVYVVNDNEGCDAIWSVDVATGADHEITDEGGGLVASRDGTRLAYGACGPGFGPDGNYFTSYSDDRTFTVMDVDGTNVSQVRASTPESVKGILWSPDGRRLLVFDHERSIHSVGVSPGERPEVVYPTPVGLDFEWVRENNVSWQPVLR